MSHQVNKAKQDLMVRAAAAKVEPHRCDCGCPVFAEGFVLKFISGIIVGSSGPLGVPNPVMYCVACRKPMQPPKEPGKQIITEN